MIERIYKKAILIVVLILFIFGGCDSNFNSIQPGSSYSGQVSFQGLQGHRISVRFLYSVPLQYSPKKLWPLVVTLHGYGSNAEAFHDLWKPVTDDLGFVLLTPQGEAVTVEGFGWQWGMNAERSVLACMDLVRKAVNIDPRRVYLAGFSAGGRITYEIGLKNSHIFQGLAPMSARFDKNYLPKNTSRLKNTRFYLSHGELETEIQSHAQNASKILQELGLEVKYVCYNGIGHDLPVPKAVELTKILEYLDKK